MNGLQIESIIVGTDLMLALLGLGVAVIMPGIDRWSKRFFTIYFLILALYIGVDMIEQISYMRPEMQSAQTAIYYFESLIVSVLMPMVTVYLLPLLRKKLAVQRAVSRCGSAVVRVLHHA